MSTLKVGRRAPVVPVVKLSFDQEWNRHVVAAVVEWVHFVVVIFVIAMNERHGRKADEIN